MGVSYKGTYFWNFHKVQVCVSWNTPSPITVNADEAGKTIAGIHRPAVYHRFIAGKGAIPE